MKLLIILLVLTSCQPVFAGRLKCYYMPESNKIEQRTQAPSEKWLPCPSEMPEDTQASEVDCTIEKRELGLIDKGMKAVGLKINKQRPWEPGEVVDPQTEHVYCEVNESKRESRLEEKRLQDLERAQKHEARRQKERESVTSLKGAYDNFDKLKAAEKYDALKELIRLKLLESGEIEE